MRKKLKEEDLIRILGLALAASITVNTTVIFSSLIGSKINKENPYNGFAITSFANDYRRAKTKSFLDDEKLLEALKEVKKMDNNEKDAYLLYYSLISNNYLDEEEKKELRNYIDYAADNPYIDSKYVYDKFQKIRTIKVEAFDDPSVNGTYDHITNTIRYINIKVSFHELCHADSKELMPQWFEEGLTALIDDEYNDCKNPSTYAFYKNVLKILSEILGKEQARDIYFRCEKEGNIDLLINELYKLGLNKNRVDKMFDLLDVYHVIEVSDEHFNKSDIEYQIKSTLAYFYHQLNKDSRGIKEYVLNLFEHNYPTLDIDKIYYLNSKKIKENPLESTQVYYYPYTKEVFTQIDSLRTKEEKTNSFSGLVQEIDGRLYFRITEKETRMFDIINPDLVIFRALIYEENLTIDEYYKIEERNFVKYNTQVKATNNEGFYELVNNYISSNDLNSKRR